jgi:acyl-CoA thioesterase-1
MKSIIMAAITNKMAAEKMARGLIASLCGMLVMACSGCGGGSGGSAPTPVAQTQPKTVLVESYGDSTMWGYNPITTLQSVDAPPALLQASLQSAYGNTVTVSNQAVSGTTLPMLISGTDGNHPAWAQQMTQSKAQIVIANFALNDDYPGVGEPVEQFQADLVTFVSTARQYGKTVILEEPNPSCDPKRATLGTYVQAIDTVASQMGVPVIAQYSYTQSLPNWQSMLPDCIHPGDALYQLKEQQEMTVISPIVKALLAG